MAPYLGSPDEQHERPKLRQIHCSGSPYEIGFQHGSEARHQVSRTIEFYTGMFKDTAKMDWAQVRELAMNGYEPVIREKWPHYHEEMRGVAEGAHVALSDIIACNVRTEITFGLFSDGCTALSWHTAQSSFLAQNWDWNEAQKANLIALTIDQSASHKPTIKMITEAGLIGKIGLNSAGVGVCLNAIKMKGADPARLPCHLGLRMVLDSESRVAAVKQLETYGVASSCHMLIGDASGAVGLEWSSADVQKCEMNAAGQVFHSNHYLQKHPSTGPDTNWLVDSTFRVGRIEKLAVGLGRGEPTAEGLFEVFKDETNAPGAICRSQKGHSTSATLFNIVMDLKARRAAVTLGRPIDPDDHLELAFD